MFMSKKHWTSMKVVALVLTSEKSTINIFKPNLLGSLAPPSYSTMKFVNDSDNE